ncbi:helix-turn-helix domain-containing protein [Algoriphagus boritolerans]|uniref:DNA-binding transcriptional regulator, XRE-family HTH domain n=1 Tax=Algoriphagus boritolerans DSM 17298 = JCM 18970 TaxID=1120964 RepID=A0A1H5XVI5_9BACT|nr:helix-turn-helix transcriptional regulator [Algoriphagus boritolerans]SEG15410.1 DNA-binding transcriptional regulator, XRE-family HTH domain [Algoriphagus boritolerans DSM 17298 = JCM 18970]
MNSKEQFGNKLTELRKGRNLTQVQLAERSGLDRPYISGIEQGKRNVSLEVIAKLAQALEIEIKTFFEE